MYHIYLLKTDMHSHKFTKHNNFYNLPCMKHDVNKAQVCCIYKHPQLIYTDIQYVTRRVIAWTLKQTG